MSRPTIGLSLLSPADSRDNKNNRGQQMEKGKRGVRRSAMNEAAEVTIVSGMEALDLPETKQSWSEKHSSGFDAQNGGVFLTFTPHLF